MTKTEAAVPKSLLHRTVEALFEERAFEDNPLTESILSEKLGEGRSRIRDSLNLLEAEDLVVRRRKKGVFVTKPTPRVIAELYDLRKVLECYAARLAVENADDKDINYLQQCADRFDEAVEKRDFAALERSNTDFHETLVRLSGSTLLIRIMERMNFIRKSFMYAYELKPESAPLGSPFSHGAIVAALKARNVAEVDHLLHNHIQVGKERVLEQALGFKVSGG